MTKTSTALREELEHQKNLLFQLNEEIKRERKRTDRIVQVLLNNLPKENLDKQIEFYGEDCQGHYRRLPGGCGFTLRYFLDEIVYP